MKRRKKKMQTSPHLSTSFFFLCLLPIQTHRKYQKDKKNNAFAPWLMQRSNDWMRINGISNIYVDFLFLFRLFSRPLFMSLSAMINLIEFFVLILYNRLDWSMHNFCINWLKSIEATTTKKPKREIMPRNLIESSRSTKSEFITFPSPKETNRRFCKERNAKIG